MTTTGLLLVTLLFWGWRTELWLFAIPMALLLESAPRMTVRFALDDAAMARVIDLSTLLWIGALIFLFIRYLNQPPLATHLYTLASWFPVLLFPPLIIQRFSTVGTFRTGHLFYSLRNADHPLAQQPIRLEPLYFIATLLAASVTDQPGYLIGAGILILWAILSARPRRVHWPIPVALVIVAGLTAYLLSMGLRQLQLSLEETFTEWFEDWLFDVDPYRARTAIGDIRDIKLSGRILLRVTPAPHDDGPWLLRDASYNSYFDGTWQAKGARLLPVSPENDGRTWSLADTPRDDAPKRMQIALTLPRGTGILPLPAGTSRLEHLPAGDLERSPLGAIKASHAPEWVNYTVVQSFTADRDAPPTAYDLALPQREQATLQQLTAVRGLAGTTPADTVNNVRTFLGPFRYSLNLTAPEAGWTALETFLFRSHTGHCEYFASATVLLLRAAGVPARYATGFSISEYSAHEGVYVGRRRDAHAWALVWLENHWQDVDTTPAEWAAFEQSHAPWWQTVDDVFSWIGAQWNRWRWRTSTTNTEDHPLLWAFAALLTVVLFWRLLRQHPIRRRPSKSTVPVVDFPGARSPFYRVIAQWSVTVGMRPIGEALGAWLQRTGAYRQSGVPEMVTLHQRWRFDPKGLSQQERHTLSEAVHIWFKRL